MSTQMTPAEMREEFPGAEECPGHLRWSAFGASYPDTVCSSALDWTEAGYEPVATLCDADDDFRPEDVPCPFCDPDGFISYQWGEPDEYRILWASDEIPVEAGTAVHFHDGEALWWTATHPLRGEERVLFHTVDLDAEEVRNDTRRDAGDREATAGDGIRNGAPG